VGVREGEERRARKGMSSSRKRKALGKGHLTKYRKREKGVEEELVTSSGEGGRGRREIENGGTSVDQVT